MFNKQKLRMIRCIQYYRITPFILILLFAIHKLTLQNKDRSMKEKLLKWRCLVTPKRHYDKKKRKSEQ